MDDTNATRSFLAVAKTVRPHPSGWKPQSTVFALDCELIAIGCPLRTQVANKVRYIAAVNDPLMDQAILKSRFAERSSEWTVKNERTLKSGEWSSSKRIQRLISVDYKRRVSRPYVEISMATRIIVYSSRTRSRYIRKIRRESLFQPRPGRRFMIQWKHDAQTHLTLCNFVRDCSQRDATLQISLSFSRVCLRYVKRESGLSLDITLCNLHTCIYESFSCQFLYLWMISVLTPWRSYLDIFLFLG